MATTHTEAVLNKLRKSELVQLVLQTDASLTSQITNLTTEVKDLLGYFKKLESDLTVTKNVNSKPMERVVQTIRDKDLEDKLPNIFEEIGVNLSPT